MKIVRFTGCISVVLMTVVLAACTSPAVPPAAAAAAATSSTYTDPFAYCAAVTNIDQPDARFTGVKMPDVIASGLKKATGASADAPMELFTRNAFWRCMDGKVYACTVGANLPCEAKANADKNPTAEETDFCKANPNQDIPAVVTGRETIYAWHCSDQTPTAQKPVFTVDPRGFLSEIWYRINP